MGYAKGSLVDSNTGRAPLVWLAMAAVKTEEEKLLIRLQLFCTIRLLLIQRLFVSEVKANADFALAKAVQRSLLAKLFVPLARLS